MTPQIDPCNIGIFIILLIVGFVSLGRAFGGGPSTSGKITDNAGNYEVRRRPSHTFTNEEILRPGIDIRREDHRQLLLDQRRGKIKSLEQAEGVVERAFKKIDEKSRR